MYYYNTNNSKSLSSSGLFTCPESNQVIQLCQMHYRHFFLGRKLYSLYFNLTEQQLRVNINRELGVIKKCLIKIIKE